MVRSKYLRSCLMAGMWKLNVWKVRGMKGLKLRSESRLTPESVLFQEVMKAVLARVVTL